VNPIARFLFRFLVDVVFFVGSRAVLIGVLFPDAAFCGLGAGMLFAGFHGHRFGGVLTDHVPAAVRRNRDRMRGDGMVSVVPCGSEPDLWCARQNDPPMNPITHFELPAENSERMVNFYAKAFGWKTRNLGPDMGNYVLVTTAESDTKGMPSKPGQINGGFFPKGPGNDIKHPSLTVAVDDIKAQMKAVKDAGGKVDGEPVEIPDFGMYVTFVDTEGKRLSMMQPNAM
jgi:predicted enzyme related to lactoylglutathione lyase